MADNLQRSVGRPEEYKFDRGGNPVEMGPFIGIVVNNIDNTRSGRLQVWIQQFGAVESDGSPKLDDPTTWRTVRYISPFYGATPAIWGNRSRNVSRQQKQLRHVVYPARTWYQSSLLFCRR